MSDHMTPRANAVIHACGRRSGLLHLTAAAFSAVVLLSPLQPSNAQDSGFWFGSGPRYPHRALNVRRRALPTKVARRVDDDDNAPPKHRRDASANAKDKAASGPLFAILSLSNQQISIYGGNGLVTRSKVSTGMPGHRTPTGIFSIIGRERWHHSNIYSGAPMPFMQRITWSGVALHLGVVPGYPASHGCIRLPAGFAQQLWGMTKIGERVVISPQEVTPAEIANPLLPVPRMQPASPLAAENTPARIAAVTTSASDPLPTSQPKMLNPIEYARSLMGRASAEVATAAKAVKENSERVNAKSDEARKAVGELRSVELARTQAEATLAGKVKALEAAKTPEARDAVATAKAASEAQLADATRRLEDAKDVEAAKTREAFDAKGALAEARASLGAAQAAAKEALRRLSPVSVLISKKDKKVYIRQALAPVLEAPVTIRDPEMPLGTHVYIAVGAPDNGSTLAWSVVSIASSNSSEEPHAARRERALARTQNTARTERMLPPSNAAEALERVDIPKDVKERISDLLWTGGSLIISDRPLSDETSDIGTDLVVTTR
jgi:lipoprotein-anchoring transpeptidase ErfK/SrfK